MPPPSPLRVVIQSFQAGGVRHHSASADLKIDHKGIAVGQQLREFSSLATSPLPLFHQEHGSAAPELSQLGDDLFLTTVAPAHARLH